MKLALLSFGMLLVSGVGGVLGVVAAVGPVEYQSAATASGEEGAVCPLVAKAGCGSKSAGPSAASSRPTVGPSSGACVQSITTEIVCGASDATCDADACRSTACPTSSVASACADVATSTCGKATGAVARNRQVVSREPSPIPVPPVMEDDTCTFTFTQGPRSCDQTSANPTGAAGSTTFIVHGTSHGHPRPMPTMAPPHGPRSGSETGAAMAYGFAAHHAAARQLAAHAEFPSGMMVHASPMQASPMPAALAHRFSPESTGTSPMDEIRRLTEENLTLRHRIEMIKEVADVRDQAFEAILAERSKVATLEARLAAESQLMQASQKIAQLESRLQAQNVLAEALQAQTALKIEAATAAFKLEAQESLGQAILDLAEERAEVLGSLAEERLAHMEEAVTSHIERLESLHRDRVAHLEARIAELSVPRAVGGDAMTVTATCATPAPVTTLPADMPTDVVVPGRVITIRSASAVQGAAAPAPLSCDGAACESTRRRAISANSSAGNPSSTNATSACTNSACTKSAIAASACPESGCATCAAAANAAMTGCIATKATPVSAGACACNPDCSCQPACACDATATESSCPHAKAGASCSPAATPSNGPATDDKSATFTTPTVRPVSFASGPFRIRTVDAYGLERIGVDFEFHATDWSATTAPGCVAEQTGPIVVVAKASKSCPGPCEATPASASCGKTACDTAVCDMTFCGDAVCGTTACSQSRHGLAICGTASCKTASCNTASCKGASCNTEVCKTTSCQAGLCEAELCEAASCDPIACREAGGVCVGGFCVEGPCDGCECDGCVCVPGRACEPGCTCDPFASTADGVDSTDAMKAKIEALEDRIEQLESMQKIMAPMPTFSLRDVVSISQGQRVTAVPCGADSACQSKTAEGTTRFIAP